MEACVKREDFSAAAAARDSVTSMQLQRRSVELRMQADATTVHLKVGKCQYCRNSVTHYRGRLPSATKHHAFSFQVVTDVQSILAVCASGSSTNRLWALSNNAHLLLTHDLLFIKIAYTLAAMYPRVNQYVW